MENLQNVQSTKSYTRVAVVQWMQTFENLSIAAQLNKSKCQNTPAKGIEMYICW